MLPAIAESKRVKALAGRLNERRQLPLSRHGHVGQLASLWCAGLVAGLAMASILVFAATDAVAQGKNLARNYRDGAVNTHELAYGLTDTHEAARIAPIAPEYRCAPYKRNNYPYPQSVEPQIVLGMGEIYGPYEARVFGSMRDTTIEHIVAISEAHDSGLCNASPALKRAFARDLDNLTLASSVVNQRKGGRDAADWVPQYNQCWFAARVVTVKRKYGLTFDQREASALRRILAQCDSTEMQFATYEVSASG